MMETEAIYEKEEISKKFEELVNKNNAGQLFNYIKELINSDVSSEEIFAQLDKYYYALPEENEIFKQALIMLRNDGIIYKIFDMFNGGMVTKIVDAYINKSDILDMSENSLTELPEAIGWLHKLKTLNLRFNRLTSLPESIGRLQQLQLLLLRDNQLTTLPESIVNLQQLRLLHLRDNRLTTLPENIGRLQQLNILLLRGNQITTIPRSIGQLQHLDELHLQGIRFSQIQAMRIRRLFEGSRTIVYINDYEQRPSAGDDTSLSMQIKVLKDIASEYKITKKWPNPLIWKELDKNYTSRAFKQFLEKVWDTKDAQVEESVLQNMLTVLINIIAKMESNSKYRQMCFSLADEAINSCGDRVAMGLIQMQLSEKGYKDNDDNFSLKELFDYEKIMLKAEKIFNIAREKMNRLISTKRMVDEIETYLRYFKELKDSVGIEIGGMLYEQLSNVTNEDIECAKKALDEISDKTVFERLVDNSIIKEMFEKEFSEIQDRPEFDTCALKGETDTEYCARMQDMTMALSGEKIKLLKLYIDKMQYLDASSTSLVSKDTSLDSAQASAPTNFPKLNIGNTGKSKADMQNLKVNPSTPRHKDDFFRNSSTDGGLNQFNP